MPSYSYTAISRRGKRVKESVEAASLETAKNSLRGAGYTILDIKEQNALNRDIELPFLGNPTAKDMAIFCRQFVPSRGHAQAQKALLQYAGKHGGRRRRIRKSGGLLPPDGALL